jgi:hypothetical protein
MEMTVRAAGLEPTELVYVAAESILRLAMGQTGITIAMDPTLNNVDQCAK